MEETLVKEVLLFILFVILGLSLTISGIYYMKKEKEDIEARKIYRLFSIIGVLLTTGTLIFYILI